MEIAIACGGTGGHIFPGLVTGRRLLEMGHDVTLWLAGRNVEANVVAGWPGKTVQVKARGFSSSLSLGSLGVVFGLMGAAYRCRRLMSKHRPKALLAMGSYASVGPVLAAWSLGVPIILHEANAVPGRAILFLSRFATRCAVTFPDTANLLRGQTRVTGLPIRDDLGYNGQHETSKGRFSVLVAGGSQGAHRLNELAVEALCLLRAKTGDTDLRVIHLAGEKDMEWVKNRYVDAGVDAEVFGFLAEMGRAYGAADLAISRSGAASCMELASCGVPSLLVPLPTARRDHQTANAQRLAEAGGAEVFPQDSLTAERLALAVESYRLAPERLNKMAESLRSLGIKQADRRLAELVIETAENRCQSKRP